jgi:SSS family solute:Na+ symporter
MITPDSKLLRFALVGMVSALLASGCASVTPPPPGQAVIIARAHAALIDVLERDEKFIKVHAAEVLIGRGEKDRVRAIFLRELERHGAVPAYRVGIWRVLAGAAPNASDRAPWIARIRAAFMDLKGADRIHAIESLGKLGERVEGDVRRAAEVMAQTAPEGEGMFAWWVLHLSGDARALPRMIAALDSADPVARSRAAYIIRWEQIRDVATLAALARAADAVRPEANGFAIIVAAALALDANPNRSAVWRAAIDRILANGSPGDRYQVGLSLKAKFSPADLPRLTPLLGHENGDVRVGAAAAILAVLERGAAKR